MMMIKHIVFLSSPVWALQSTNPTNPTNSTQKERVVMLNKQLDACVQSGPGNLVRAEMCWKMFSHSGDKPNDVTYNAMINVCAKAKDFGRAKEVFSVFLESGLQPNEITFNSMINVCAKTNKFNRNKALVSFAEPNAASQIRGLKIGSLKPS